MLGLGSDRLQLHPPAGVGSVQVIKGMPPIPAVAVKRAGSGHPPQHPAHAGVVEHRHQGADLTHRPQNTADLLPHLLKDRHGWRAQAYSYLRPSTGRIRDASIAG